MKLFKVFELIEHDQGATVYINPRLILQVFLNDLDETTLELYTGERMIIDERMDKLIERLNDHSI